MTDASAQAAAPSPSTVRKVALAAMAGSAIEWYDFFIYLTAAALVFGPLYFPGESEVAGVLASFSTAAVGFVARPIGGILFGHYGDRLGRKPTLVIALLLMGTATTLVGVLPTFATIGVAAPILLFVLRFLQGLAVGGQWGGAVLLSTEYAPEGKRGFYGSFAQAGVPVGLLLGNTVFLLISAIAGEQAFSAWAWRIPFLLNTASVPLIIVSLCIAQFFLGMMYGPQAALFSEMFSARVRYSGASIGYQGASVFAGGLAPIIMVWLLESTGTSLSVSFYMLAMAAITFVSVYLITETYGDEMTRDQAAETEEVAIS